MQENLKTATNAEGTLTQQQEIYAESWEAARDRVRNAAEDIYDSLINDDFFIDLDNTITPFLSTLAKIIDAFDGLQGVLSLVAIWMNKVYGEKIAQAMRDMATNIGIISNKEIERARTLQVETASLIERMQVSSTTRGEQNNLEILKQEIELRGIINSKYDSLSAKQKEFVKDELQKIQLQKQFASAANEAYAKAERAYEASSKEIFSGSHDISSSVIKQLKEAVYAWNAGSDHKINLKFDTNLENIEQQINRFTSGLQKQLSEKNNLYNLYSSLNKSAKDYEAQLKQLYITEVNGGQNTTKSSQQIHQFFDNLRVEALDLNNLLAQMIELSDMAKTSWTEMANTAINEVNKKLPKSYQIDIKFRKNANFDKSLNLLVDKVQDTVKKINKHSERIKILEKIKTQVENGAISFEEAQKKLKKEYGMTVGKNAKDQVQYIEALNRQINTSNKTIENSKFYLEQIKTVISSMGFSSTNVDVFIDDLQKLYETGKISKEALDSLLEAMKKLGREEIPKKIDWADNLVLLGTTISQVSMAMNALQSITKTVSQAFDEEISGIEAFTSVMMSLGLILPIIVKLSQEIVKKNASVGLSYLFVGASAQAASKGITSVGLAINAALPLIGLISIALMAVVVVLKAILPTAEKSREKMEKATAAYKEQKDALESLNDELKTTQDRMKELSEQDSLTIVEQEELDKLRLREASLKRQIELQKQLTLQSQREQANKIKKEFGRGYGKLASELQTTRLDGYNLEDGTYVVVFETPEEWFSRTTKGLSKDSKEYQDALVEYEKWTEENRQKRAEWVSKNTEEIKQAEEDYLSYIQAIQDGAIEEDKATTKQMQDILAENRRASYDTVGEYQKVFINPLLEESENYGIKSSLLNSFVGEGKGDKNLLPEAFKETLLYAGISVEELFDNLDSQITSAEKKIEKFGENSELKNLSGEDLLIISELNLDKLETAEDVLAAIAEYKKNKIEIKVSVDGLEEVKELVEIIQGKQEPLEELISSYNEEGKLNPKEVNKALLADPSLAKYIAKNNNGDYVLVNQAIKDFDRLAAQEELLIDTTLNATKNKMAINKDYIDNYIDLLEDSLKKIDDNNYFSSDSQNRFKTRNKSLIASAQLYKENSITAEKYFDVIRERLDNLTIGFHDLNKEINGSTETTDQYEKTFSAMVGMVADGLNDLNKQFESGEIQMQEYYEGTVSGLETLIAIESKRYKGITKNSEGIWELSDAFKDLSDEEKEVAKAGLAQLNIYEERLKAIQQQELAIDLLTEHAEYLKEFANDFGQIDFTINDNFDETSERFKALVEDIKGYLTSLAKDSPEAFEKAIAAMSENNKEFAKEAEKLTIESVKSDSDLAFSEVNINGQAVQQLTNHMIGENSAAVQDTVANCGDLLSALGTAIKDLDYTISFTPQVSGKFPGINQILDAFKNGTSVSFPSLSYNIAGKDNNGSITALGDALLNFGKSLNENSGAITDGIFAYTKRPFDNKLATPSNIGGGGGGGSSDPKKLDSVNTDLRYRKVDRAIDSATRSLEKLDTQAERTFGVDKITLMRQGIEGIARQTELLNQKLSEAEGYLKDDLAAIRDLGLSPIVDSNNEITNYDEIVRQLDAAYNKEIEAYNKMSAAQQEKHQERMDQLKEEYDKSIKALEKYVETVDTYNEVIDELEETRRAAWDKSLEVATKELEITIKIKEVRQQIRDLDRKILESSGDYLTTGEEILALEVERMEEAKGLTEVLESTLAELNSLAADPYADTEALTDALLDLSGEAISSAEDLLEFLEIVKDHLPNAVDAARERLDYFLNTFEHNDSIIETTKELMALQGVSYKTAEGLGRLQKAAAAQLSSSKAAMATNKQWYDSLVPLVAEAEAELANYEIGTQGYEIAKAARDSLLEEMRSAETAMLSSAVQTMETAREMFETQVDSLLYSLEQKLTDGFGFELLQEKYDHLIAANERYLDEVNQIYQIEELNMKIQADIDKAQGQYSINKLQGLQDELKLMSERNDVSAYELEIMNAKYAMLQAQIALEEAQNAKSQVRLVRDDSGNWNYQFTANQDDINKAQQKYNKAVNDYYNIAKEYAKTTSADILSIQQEMMDKLREIWLDEELTEQERRDRMTEVQRYYFDQAKYLYAEQQKAIRDTGEAGKLVIEDFSNTFTLSLDGMTGDFDTFRDNSNQTIGEMENSFRDYQDIINEVAESSGLDLESLRTKIDEVNESTELAAETAEQTISDMAYQISVIQDSTNAWAAEAEAIMEVVRARRELSSSIARDTVARSSAKSENGYIDADYSRLMSTYLERGGSLDDAAFIALQQQREKKVADKKAQGLDASYWGASGQEMLDRFASGYRVEKYSEEEFLELMRRAGIAGFDSGGYTGDWGRNGKLALLHEKELVLNKDDTKNILGAVSLIKEIGPMLFKSISQALDKEAAASQVLMGSRLSSPTVNNLLDKVVQQVVSIEASFPNVETASEIEMALTNLVNEAAQRAAVR